MKYIVELEDEPCMRENGVNYYICKSAPWYNLGETVINRLTPYTEPDRKAIEDEVWELVGVIANMDNNDYGRVFGCIGRWTLLSKKTYQEVKAKYEAWKKQKEEIHVGDEVRCMDRVGIVVRIDSMDGGSNVVWEDGATAYIGVKDLTKTGCHFDEVDELLKKMRGDKE